jgi:hypothetical protein
MFHTFTNSPIADRSIALDSREQADKILSPALENGATRYRESADHGRMYCDCTADLGGHQWDILFTDPTQIPQ